MEKVRNSESRLPQPLPHRRRVASPVAVAPPRPRVNSVPDLPQLEEAEIAAEPPLAMGHAPSSEVHSSRTTQLPAVPDVKPWLWASPRAIQLSPNQMYGHTGVVPEGVTVLWTGQPTPVWSCGLFAVCIGHGARAVFPLAHPRFPHRAPRRCTTASASSPKAHAANGISGRP